MYSLNSKLSLSRLAAFFLLLLMIAAFTLGGLIPLRQDLAIKRDRLLELREQIGRYQNALMRGGRLEIKPTTSKEHEAWTGKSRPIVAAKLQEVLQRQAGVNQLAISRVLPINGKKIEGFESIGVRIECDGEIVAIRDFVGELEDHRPYIFVSSIEFRPKQNYGYSSQTEQLPLSARIDVYVAVKLEG